MTSRGHTVGILTADPSGKLPRHEIVEGMDIKRVPAWLSRTDFCLAPGLATGVKTDAWDIVHVQGYHTFSAPLAMAASSWKRVPFVLTFHSGGHSSRLRHGVRDLQYAVLRPLVRRAARLIAVSQFEAHFFSAKMQLDQDRFTVVPNGASLPASPANATSVHDGPLIVSLGRLERYKGHHRILEAFKLLLGEIPAARLRILGEGPYRDELEQLIHRLDLTESVAIGAIPPAERHAMASLLKSADLVTLFSEYEAHPIAVLEALSLGVPVMTSDTSGFRELAAKQWVRAIPIDSSNQRIARAMSASLQAERMQGRIVLPDWDDCTDQLLSIYRSVVADAVGGREAPLAGALSVSGVRSE